MVPNLNNNNNHNYKNFKLIIIQFFCLVVLKFPQVQACSTLGFARCGPSLLSLFQSFGIWLFSFPMYVLIKSFIFKTI